MTGSSLTPCGHFRDAVTHWMEGALSPASALRMERHRQACADCRRHLRQLRLVVESLRALGRDEGVDAQAPRLLQQFREWHRTQDCRSPSLWVQLASLRRELGRHPAEQHRSVLREHTSWCDPALAELALDQAAELGVRCPSDGLELAEVGLALCQSLAEPPTDDPRASDRLGRAWATLGNARRICSDFVGATQAFNEAERALAAGLGNASQRARLLQFRALLSADMGQVSVTARHIREAVSIYESLGDAHGKGRTLISKGTLLSPPADPLAAAEILREGLNLIDQAQEPRLVLVAKHNLVQYLFEAGRREEAERLLPETRHLHSVLSNEVDLMRFQWLEGKIALEGHDLESAERALVEVKQYFVARGIAYDAALVSLDLAMVYVEQGRASELRSLAGEMLTIFRSLGIRRETLAALAFFRRALELEQSATVGLLQELAEVLETARRKADFHTHLSVSS